MNFSYRYRFHGLKTDEGEVKAHFVRYSLPKFLSSKETLFLSEEETWHLDRGYFDCIVEKQNKGMPAWSPKSISLLKTHDNLHEGFLEIRRYKSNNGIDSDVNVTFM
jgi:hypothetical protein